MKILRRLLPIAIAAVACVTGCKKNESDPSASPGPVTNQGSFSADIDGSYFTGTQIKASFVDGTPILIIEGINNKKAIGLLIVSPAVGSFKTDSSSTGAHNQMLYSPDTTLGDNYAYKSNGDNIYITSYDAVNKKISGTFSFKGYAKAGSPTANVTSGIFSNVAITSTQSSKLTAKINNTPFTGLYCLAEKNSDGTISIIQTDVPGGNAPTLALRFPANATAGQHNLGAMSNYLVTYYKGGTDYYSSQLTTANPGTITITKNDVAHKAISGTFTSVVTDDKGDTNIINDGSFTVTYQ